MYCENCERKMENEEKRYCSKKMKISRPMSGKRVSGLTKRYKRKKLLSCLAVIANFVGILVLCISPGFNIINNFRTVGKRISYNYADQSTRGNNINPVDAINTGRHETECHAILGETKKAAKTLSADADFEEKMTEGSHAETLSDRILGTWYQQNSSSVTYDFLEDGSGTYKSTYKSTYDFYWELDEDNTLRLTYNDGVREPELYYNVRVDGESLKYDYEINSVTYKKTLYRNPNYHYFYIDGEYNYNEGLVWLECGEKDDFYWVCVDKEGNGLFQFSQSEVTSVTSFSNGYAYLIGSNYVAVIDTNGNVTSTYPEDEHNFILNYGDGYVLTEEFVADFDTSGYIVRLCDYKGNVLAQSTREIDGIDNDYQIADYTTRSAYYCGKGVFGVTYREGAEFLTSSGMVWTFPNDDVNVDIWFSEDMAALNYDKNTGVLSLINTEGEIIKYDTRGADIKDNAELIINNGVCVYKCDSKSTLGLYNVETGESLELQQYTDKIYWDLLPDSLVCVNDRITVPFKGSDGELYVGAFDKEWNTIIKPVRAERYYGYSDGYLIVNDGENTYIYDTSGEIVFSKNDGNRYYRAFSDGVTRETRFQVGNVIYNNDPAYVFMNAKGNILYYEIDMSNVVTKGVYDTSMVNYEHVNDTPKEQLSVGDALQNRSVPAPIEMTEDTAEGDMLQNQIAPAPIEMTEETTEGAMLQDQIDPGINDATEDMESTEKSFLEDDIHRYEVFLQDGTWEDAFNACLEKGGYLLRINTQEEYDQIITELDSLGCRGCRFYIGGRRELSGQQYFWVDNMDSFIGSDLASVDAWCVGNWMIGEPSLRDDVIHAEEDVMELFYYNEENRWVWNDVPNNLPYYIGKDAAKKVGYICEYNE